MTLPTPTHSGCHALACNSYCSIWSLETVLLQHVLSLGSHTAAVRAVRSTKHGLRKNVRRDQARLQKPGLRPSNAISQVNSFSHLTAILLTRLRLKSPHSGSAGWTDLLAARGRRGGFLRKCNQALGMAHETALLHPRPTHHVLLRSPYAPELSYHMVLRTLAGVHGGIPCEMPEGGRALLGGLSISSEEKVRVQDGLFRAGKSNLPSKPASLPESSPWAFETRTRRLSHPLARTSRRSTLSRSFMPTSTPTLGCRLKMPSSLRLSLRTRRRRC